jgi:PPK2 family polyphosphate:nucleotide phosphotransferase
MKINSSDFIVQTNSKLDLSTIPTKVARVFKSEAHYAHILSDHIKQLSALQELLYASNNFSVLLIFQAMDAAGKDGAIKHIMSGVNPQGCQVFSFKHPSVAELQHDFLWRTTRDLPERGQIGIFNRSYYEEVLIVRVHPEILSSEGLHRVTDQGKTIWQERFNSITDLENHLSLNGVCIIKFYLHLSQKEQRKRFIARLDTPSKNWKFSQADIDESHFWPSYMTAYQECLSATSTPEAPWYVIPADDKKNTRLLISHIILDKLTQLKMAYPKVSPEKKNELILIRKQLKNAVYPKKSPV